MKKFDFGKYLQHGVLLTIFLISLFSIFLAFIHTGRVTYGKNPALYASFLENNFYDYRYLHTLKNPKPSQQMTLASIDDKSIEQIGRFPWTRTVWVRLIEKLEHFGAKAVAFDVMFSEEELACKGNPDLELDQAIKSFKANSGDVIMPYMVTPNKPERLKMFPEEMFDHIIDSEGGNANHMQWYFSRANYPIKTLLANSPGMGFINNIEDFDGIFRNYQMYANTIADDLIEGLSKEDQAAMVQFFPSLGLAAYRAHTGDKVSIDARDKSGVTFLRAKTGTIMVDQEGTMKIRYRGDRYAFDDVSIIDILNAKDDDFDIINKIKDRTIFIGSTAAGAHDLRHSPVDAKLPGVFIHMNVMDMLLEGRYFKTEEESLLWSLAFFLLGTILIIFIQTLGHAVYDAIALIALLIGVYFIDINYFLPKGYQLKLFFCFFNYVAIYAWNTFINFHRTNKEKKQIRGTFSRYVSPAIVNEMLASPDKLKIGGEKKHITVFFSDVRDFTSISEKLSPTELSHCLNQYMGRMTDILFDYKGTLDKYIGDAIVGYWGAPIDVDNHAYWGLKASVKMIEVLPEINESFKEQGYPEFKVGIGMNTGECSVGNMGSDSIFSYTALGDHMNLGARIEGLCKFYGAQILISEYTRDAIKEEHQEEFTFREVDFVQVKGKEEPVKIIEVLHSTHPLKLDPYALEVWREAYDLFYEREFEKCHRILEPLLEKHPLDKSLKRLSKQCEIYIENPPHKDWNGVNVYTEK